MAPPPRLYCELVALLGQHSSWRDLRHLSPLSGLVVGRARYAQSVQRRFERWLHTERVEEQPFYNPLIQTALAEWGHHVLYLALDTSMLWNRFCLIRLSVIYRGRAVPVVWEVREHGSSSGAHESYGALLTVGASLLPQGVQVVFLADRGGRIPSCSASGGA